MKTLSDIFNTPYSDCEYSYDDMLLKRSKDNNLFNKKIKQENANNKLRHIVSKSYKSGIEPLYENCTINNFIITNKGQQKANDFAYKYVLNFNENKGCGFVFSGDTGVGKNHLAAAICNNLIVKGKSCLIIKVEELMMQHRDCYRSSSKITELEFLKTIIDLDLLIIDEIGLQRKDNDNDKIILNHIIDKRISNFRPTGLLTNKSSLIVTQILGSRIMNRMKTDGGGDNWIEFKWESFRK